MDEGKTLGNNFGRMIHLSIGKLLSLMLCGLLCFTLFAGCGGEGAVVTPGTAGTTSGGAGDTPATEGTAPEGETEPSADTTQALEEKDVDNIQATITMEDGGTIVLELYPDIAPQSVQNFVSLARQGYYDGLKFHRIIKGFMIQGGCPDGNGTGGPGYSIFGEFDQNGWKNDLKHKRGVVSMARSGLPNSAGSQFFIVHKDANFLDGAYAAFGKVLSGMDIVDQLADTPAIDDNGTVLKEDMPVIKSITIDSDIELPEPDKMPR